MRAHGCRQHTRRQCATVDVGVVVAVVVAVFVDVVVDGRNSV
jgi:hypothetical protein